MKRRDLLLLGGVIAVIAGLQGLARRRETEFSFDPLPDLPPYRRLAQGEVSGADPLFVGLEPVSDQRLAYRDAVRADPAEALFGPVPAGRLPIAVFTDYNCPYCPSLSRTVIAFSEGRSDLSVTWHELPILGPASERAARAALAAGLQGAYLPVHRTLMSTTLRPGPTALRALALEHGLDPDRLIADAEGEEVTTRIEKARAIADVLGLYGTPALVIGRTVALGRIDRTALERLVETERRNPAD